MTNKITSRDMEAISAYLDNELKPREHARLAARLKAEPGLRGALNDLKQTRTLLRNVPQVRAPRSFTLTPELAPRRSSFLQIFPTLQFASALAAILLVLFVAGDAFGVLSPLPVFPTAQSVAAPEAFMQDDMGAGAEGAMPAEEPMAAETVVEKSASELEIAADAAVVGESEGAAVEERAMEAGEAEQMPAAPLEMESSEQLEVSPQNYALQTSEISPTQVVEEPAPQLEAAPLQPVPGQDQTEEIFEPIGVPGLRLVEILLAAIFVVSGAAAFALRRRLLG